MPKRGYSLLRGQVLDYRGETSGKSPHFQILVDAGDRYRIAINTRSGSSRGHEADLLFFADRDFRHPVVERLQDVPDGMMRVQSRPNGLALDYQRGGMFDRRDMRRVPWSIPGPNNDLIDELEGWVQQAIAFPSMRIFVYGTRWGPEERNADHIFGFRPGNGMHDVHMNQGNRDEHFHDNGAWADGGLLFFDKDARRWGAIFLAFQTQSWHTDERGNPIEKSLASQRRN
ncbi:MAG: DUF2278 family protein [Thermomicrobiales bacterium]